MTEFPEWIGARLTHDGLRYNQLLFHGTLEPFDGRVTANALDNVAWFSDMPAVAQSYCPASGSEILFSFPSYDQESLFAPASSAHDALFCAMGHDPQDMDRDFDQSGMLRSYRHVENHPTKRDAARFLEDLGYDLADGSAWVKVEMTTQIDEIRPANWKAQGRLFIIERPKSLKLFDYTGAEGGLSGCQWQQYEQFELLSQDERWDGVIISDVHQTRSLGHFEHTSIGLFDRTLQNLRWASIPCCHHDPGADVGSFRETPEFPLACNIQFSSLDDNENSSPAAEKYVDNNDLARKAA